MKSQIDYEKILPIIEMSNSLEKNIFQVYINKNFDKYPLEIEQNIRNLKNISSGWNYHLYDNNNEIKNFILENYGETILSYFNKISDTYGAAKADFFRYLLIYKRGGIYIDLKTTFTKPLDEVISTDEKYILTHWDNREGEKYFQMGLFDELNVERGEWIQWAIVARRGHPMLRAIIIEMLKRIDNYSPFTTGVGLMGVIRTTGPIMYTQTIENFRKQIDADMYRILDKPQDIGLRYSVYDADGAFAHKKALKNNYNIKLDAVINNGSEFYTKYFRFYFWSKFALQVLMDKIKMKLA